MGEETTIKTYGLIGKTLDHSFSKKYFNEKFDHENIDAVYQNFELNAVSYFKNLLYGNPVDGLNVTNPYKEDIIPFLDEIDSKSEKIGAVNTICILKDKTIGYNTDCVGFKKSLVNFLGKGQDLKETIKNSGFKAMVLGTGGASKAVQFALEELHIPFHIVSRNAEKGNYIYDDLNEEIIKQHQLIINTTPLGTSPNISEKPPLPYQFITKDHLLFDLVYNPTVTAFMQHGIDKGAKVINGYEMLTFQAEAAWEIWNKV